MFENINLYTNEGKFFVAVKVVRIKPMKEIVIHSERLYLRDHLDGKYKESAAYLA